jgi:hypothetical protein
LRHASVAAIVGAGVRVVEDVGVLVRRGDAAHAVADRLEAVAGRLLHEGLSVGLEGDAALPEDTGARLALRVRARAQRGVQAAAGSPLAAAALIAPLAAAALIAALAAAALIAALAAAALIAALAAAALIAPLAADPAGPAASPLAAAGARRGGAAARCLGYFSAVDACDELAAGAAEGARAYHEQRGEGRCELARERGGDSFF